MPCIGVEYVFDAGRLSFPPCPCALQLSGCRVCSWAILASPGLTSCWVSQCCSFRYHHLALMTACFGWLLQPVLHASSSRTRQPTFCVFYPPELSSGASSSHPQPPEQPLLTLKRQTLNPCHPHPPQTHHTPHTAGDLPNVYVYACNNPSESIIAKRRGYGTIVSYNVPPYGRAGLYKQLSELKGLLSGAPATGLRRSAR